MTRRELILSIVALALGIAVGFAGGGSLEGTAANQDKDSDNEARAKDDRILYQVDLEAVEVWLLEGLDPESEEYAAVSAQIETMKSYDDSEDFTAVFGENVEESQIDIVLVDAYAHISGQDVATLDDVVTSEEEFALEVIIGEWADPYDLTTNGAPVLQFYLKVPPSLTDNLPEGFEEMDGVPTLDKPLETTIFWKSLRGIPTLEE